MTETAGEYCLYWGPNMGSLPIQALLLELDLPHRLEQVNFGAMEHRNDDYLTVNPVGKVPALQLPDGRIMTESAAILIYLADLRPAAGLLPAPSSPKRPEALRWLLYLASEMYPTACHYYTPEFYGDEAAAGSIRNRGKRSFDAQCRLLESQLADGQAFVLGDDYSVVDLFLMTLLDWHDDPSALTAACPKLAAIAERVKQRPAVRAARQRHQMPD